MNHLTAAQKGEGGGWHYVSLNSRQGGHPLGYCGEHEPHATEAEARACYRGWQRDHVTLDGGTWSWSTCDVKGCGNPARNGVRVEGDGYALAVVCDEHHNLEHAIAALGLEDDQAGDAWQS